VHSDRQDDGRPLNRMKFQTDQFYFKTAAEMRKFSVKFPEAMRRHGRYRRHAAM